MLQRKIEDFLPAHPVYYFRDCVHRQDYVSRQSLFLWWSRAAVVYLYVCMREDHLYIELIEQEKPTHTHTQKSTKTTLMLLCPPSRTVKRTSN